MTMSRRRFLEASAATTAGLVLARHARAARPRTPLKVLILGGTSFLGPELARAALAAGHSVTLFNRGRIEERRREAGRAHEFMDKVEVLYGNRDPNLAADDWKPADQRDPKAPKGLAALEGRAWDAVIDTSGYVPRIVKASADLLAPHVKHYTFVSSMSVYASNAQIGLDESAPVGTMADPSVETMGESFENYGPLKALCEQAAEAAMPGRVANVRPGLIVGPGDPTGRFTYWPARIDKGGEVLAPGNPDDPVQYIDVRDLAEWIIRLAQANVAGVFNALGPPADPGSRCTIGQVLSACMTNSANDASLTWVSAAFLREQGVSPWGDMPLWIPPEGESVGFHQRSNAKAVGAGLTFRPVGVTCADTLAWFKGLPETARANAARGLSSEREAAVLKAWHARKPG
ncbi:MAG: NAD-dependent epimerase/dehydratase family protein [Phycisphaerales bacterium]|nr:NAD-dependent epimerase/dehydratase family protein [Phycisphaerales bacterium]